MRRIFGLYRTLTPTRTSTPQAITITKTQRRQLSQSSAAMNSLHFENTALAELPVDPIENNTIRQVPNACFSRVKPSPVDNPKFIAVSDSALKLLDLTEQQVLEDPDFPSLFSGNDLFTGSDPSAHCYCGHQFGFFAGQLGDGRAISLGEVVNKKGERWEIQLKGSGQTPYSRFADGRAVLRSSIREYLCSEYFAALNIPTTRAATLIISDTKAIRDPLYNGNQILEPCAIVSRLAPSFIRFGSWEIFVSNDDRIGPSVGNEELPNQMLDYVIKYHFPEILKQYSQENEKEKRYLTFFEEVVKRTARLVADWQLIGFTHGVLNTDNMSILGLTIDFGPFGFMDKYNPNFVPNTSDQEGRYRFEAQPSICKWNLIKLAEALATSSPQLEPQLDEIIYTVFDKEFNNHYQSKLRKKLGLIQKELPEDKDLFESLFKTFYKTCGDFTNSFRCLSKIKIDSDNSDVIEYLVQNSGTIRDSLLSLGPVYNALQIQSLKLLQKESPQTFLMITKGKEGAIEEAEEKLLEVQRLKSLTIEQKRENDRTIWTEWIEKYIARLKLEQEGVNEEEKERITQERVKIMNSTNPKFLLRNYLIQEAIKLAEKGDFSEVHRLQRVMLKPFDEHEGEENLGIEGKVPEWACNLGLSCSS